MKPKQKLNNRQKQFCREYVIDMNGAQAAIRTGFSAKSAKEQASRLLTNANVKNYIQELIKKRAEKSEVTAERVIKELAKVAFIDIRKYYDENDAFKGPSKLDDEAAAALAGMDVEEVKDMDGIPVGLVKKIKLQNKIAALEILAKHLGIFSKDNEQRKGEATVFFLPKEDDPDNG